MASWKKVIVSGSGAHLSSVTASNLAQNQLVSAGDGGVLQNSGLNLSSSVLNIGGNSIQSSGSNSILTGSFTGSFTGTFSGVSSILKISGSTSGNTTVDLTSHTLIVSGSPNEIEATVTDQTITIGLPDNVTIGNNLTVNGNFTVNGTSSFINTENVLVEDRFILLASGSSTGTDGGIIIQSGSAGNGFGLYFDASSARWAVSENTSHTSSNGNATPTYFVGFVTSSGVAPSSTAPTYSSTTAYGTMHIDTATNSGEIWIYA